MHEKRSRGSEEPRGHLIPTRADSDFERSARTAKPAIRPQRTRRAHRQRRHGRQEGRRRRKSAVVTR
jgi:hypothetical protein